MTMTVSLEEAKQDVMALTDEELMTKYQLSRHGLRLFFHGLLRTWARGGTSFPVHAEIRDPANRDFGADENSCCSL